MAITIAIPCQPNFWQYRTSVYRKFGMVMVIDFTKPKVWYGNWYEGFGTVTVPNPPLLFNIKNQVVKAKKQNCQMLLNLSKQDQT